MIIAGMDAITHLTIRKTIDQNGILTSVTVTASLFELIDMKIR